MQGTKLSYIARFRQPYRRIGLCADGLRNRMRMAFYDKFRCVIMVAQYHILWSKNLPICLNFAKLRGYFRQKIEVFEFSRANHKMLIERRERGGAQGA